jgi:RNA polymerase sigma-70 factor (ECF subfamily)
VEERETPDAPVDRVDRFRELYDATYPRIMAYTLRRAVSREDALDAVSETFMVVWRRLDDIPGGRSTVPWVFGVARRALANQYRSRDRRAQLDHRLLDNANREPEGQSFDLVHEALDQLRPDDREILTLATWDDLDNDEIAEVLGTSARNVAVRMHRARKRLARELRRIGLHEPQRNPDQVKSEDRYRTPNQVNGTLPGPGEVETP